MAVPRVPWVVPVILSFVLLLIRQTAGHGGLFRATWNGGQGLAWDQNRPVTLSREPKALLGLSSIIYIAQSVTSRELRGTEAPRGCKT